MRPGRREGEPCSDQDLMGSGTGSGSGSGCLSRELCRVRFCKVYSTILHLSSFPILMNVAVVLSVGSELELVIIP